MNKGLIMLAMSIALSTSTVPYSDFISIRHADIKSLGIQIDPDIEKEFKDTPTWSPNSVDIQILRELQKLNKAQGCEAGK